MDADQTMVPGQQVYYTQSDDGQIITSFSEQNPGNQAAQESTSQQQVSLFLFTLLAQIS